MTETRRRFFSPVSLPRSTRRLAVRILSAILLASVLPVVALRWLPPPTSAFMLEAWAGGLLSGQNLDLRYQWTAWDAISPEAALAVMASEDQLFPEHDGFDFHAISRAISSNRKGRPLRGASTISQQTAKNLFLYSGKSLWRKALEAYFTVLLEGFWPKQRILETYLNIAQFGKGIYGVSAAAETFFHKPARDLTTPEAALLAAVLPNPVVLRADRPSNYVLKRRQWIMRQMRLMGGRGYLNRLAP